MYILPLRSHVRENRESCLGSKPDGRGLRCEEGTEKVVIDNAVSGM